jgi:hypothetical protein
MWAWACRGHRMLDSLRAESRAVTVHVSVGFLVTKSEEIKIDGSFFISYLKKSGIIFIKSIPLYSIVM